MKRPKSAVLVFFHLLLLFLMGVGLGAQEREDRGGEEPASGKTSELPPLQRALERAGQNRPELEEALAALEGARRESLEFLIVNMPERDLRELSSQYLLENVNVTHDVLATVSWGQKIPRAIFLNDVLPYACVNERRDPWRRQFAERFLPIIADCRTAAEAAQRLNEKLSGELGVKYSTRRRKPDQSPFESMESGMASCTGLSILLADACRSVGVPARVVGIPSWVNKRGNHTWVEIWDGEWHFTGACEPDPRGLDHTWFQKDASLAIKDSRWNAIYATSFQKTEVTFPMVWAREADYVSAVNVTDRYAAGKKETTKGRLLVRVLDREGGARVAARVQVTDGEDSSASVKGTSRDESADTNDILAFDLERDRSYEIRVAHNGREARRECKLEDEQQIVTIVLGETPQRVTLAQIYVTRDVRRNLARMRAALLQAKKDKAQWILFPEGALSGYYNGFDQREVAAAFQEVRALCRDAGVNALVGTCWKEGGRTYNEIRIVDSSGELVGRYAKKCLTYGDARQFARGDFPLVHRVSGLTCGTLICNDLWVTPGFTDGPNPHLSLQQARAGAQVIFHAVNSGTSGQYRDYHESNLKVRSAEAKCPFVVVNAAYDKPINCASGVVSGFEYVVSLPRAGEVIRTVEFTPRGTPSPTGSGLR